MIAIRKYYEISRGRMPSLPSVASEFSERMKLAQRPEEFLKAHEELFAGEIPRQLVDRQVFYFNYIERLRAMSFTGALVMHGMNEEEVKPNQNLINDLLKHSERAG